MVAVKALACELPAKADKPQPLARWQCPDLARAAVEQGIAASISGTTIWRWLSLNPRMAEVGPHRSFLILIVVGWRVVSAGLSSFSCVLRSGLSAGGQAVAGSGGLYPMVLCHSASQAFDQGQWVGRCRIGRRWGRAGRAGMVTILRRRVAPRATA